ncbi:hypothetical protein Avbf_16664, partial [Armadillidium vulgare]
LIIYIFTFNEVLILPNSIDFPYRKRNEFTFYLSLSLLSFNDVCGFCNDFTTRESLSKAFIVVRWSV